MESFMNLSNNNHQMQQQMNMMMQKNNHTIAVQKTQQVHTRACKNCTKLHHKCDKMSPACSHCLKRNVPCEINPSVKKRGRPFGTTKDKIQQKKESEIKISSPKPQHINNNNIISNNDNNVSVIISGDNNKKNNNNKRTTDSQKITYNSKKIKLEDTFTEFHIPHTVAQISSAKIEPKKMEQNMMINTALLPPVDINWDYNLESMFDQGYPSSDDSLFQNDFCLFQQERAYEVKVEAVDFDHLNTFLINPEDLFY
jgi:hypothetical protein